MKKDDFYLNLRNVTADEASILLRKAADHIDGGLRATPVMDGGNQMGEWHFRRARINHGEADPDDKPGAGDPYDEIPSLAELAIFCTKLNRRIALLEKVVTWLAATRHGPDLATSPAYVRDFVADHAEHPLERHIHVPASTDEAALADVQSRLDIAQQAVDDVTARMDKLKKE